ncbi:NAD(P)-binding domain-containing protein [uncultured Jatrophihabitans sp.]|uniref:NAD(P)-binding domain-containing protein n=1 Tax=uncultured Jatrophihabitans sp. TaxID=1610747 RepID=UPI0035CB5174
MSAQVCVIGAGSSGIAACQVLQARGIEFDCYEAGSEVGGNWRYLNDNEMSSSYRSLHINTSREVMEYRSFPMRHDYPTYPNHAQIAEYFDRFVDHFGLRDRIRFRTEVVSVVPDGGEWVVGVRARGSADVVERRYAAVLVANGHHWDPRWPEPAFPGAETFTGEQVHSHHYKTFDGYEGKRVLVLGIGNSACDIAVETSRVSERTFLAMRRGAHVIPKYVFGIPTDHLTTSPLARVGSFAIQRALLSLIMRAVRGDVTKYGLPKPDHKIASAHPTISDDLLVRLGHGDVAVKPNIARLDGDTVHFVDGSSERIDVIVYCTGYKISFPFFDESLVNAQDNDISLYHRVVDPAHPGLYFVGLVQPLGAIMPLAEAQAEWVADLLDGTATLPSDAAMQAEIASYRRALAKRYVRSKRHTIQVDFLEHLGELRRERTAGRRRVGQPRSLPSPARVAVSGQLDR